MSFNYTVQGDPIKIATWTAKLIKRMELMHVKYREDRTGEICTPTFACMRVASRGVTYEPEIIVGANYCTDFTNELAIPTLLHELGHVQDYRKCGSNFQKYVETYGTFEMEIKAWENAFELARQIGYHNYSTMKEYAEKCLHSYFDFYEKNGYNSLDVRCYTGNQMSRSECMERLDKALESAQRKYRKALMGL